MDNDRVNDSIRRMAELPSQLSELEILKDTVGEAQQRALSGTILSSALMEVRTTLH